MKTVSNIVRLVMLFTALLLPAIDCVSQTFGFSSSKIVMGSNGNAVTIPESGVLVLQKDGSSWIAQLSLNNDPGPVDRLSTLKVLTEKGKTYIKGVGSDLKFEINEKQLSIVAGNFAIIFPNGSLKADYASQYDALMKALGYSQSGNKKPSNSVSQGTKGNASAALPTSGNLSAAVFARHPFGFMPEGPISQSRACTLLNQAGWPSKPYDNSLIYIISHTAFSIPFKFYGKNVSTMSMSWDKGENTSYDLVVSDYKTNWTESDARQLSQKIYDDLLKNGYRPTEVKFTYSGHFFEKAVTDGSVYIQISAGQSSKLASLDAFSVTTEVRYL